MSPNHADLRPLAQGLSDRFYQRRDVIAVYDERSQHWRPDDQPITGPLLTQHLTEEKVLGAYLLDAESNCRFFTLDMDFNAVGHSYRIEVEHIKEALRLNPEGELPDAVWPDEAEPCNPREVWLEKKHPLRPWLAFQIRSLAAGMAWRAARLYSLPVAVAYSGGKGLHVHVFCGTRPAHEARKMANGLMCSWVDYQSPPDGPLLGKFETIGKTASSWRDRTAMYDNITIEVYPKQDALENGGYGNLVRLPLGIHPVTKQKSYFINLETIPTLYPLSEFDALTALTKGCVIRDH